MTGHLGPSVFLQKLALGGRGLTASFEKFILDAEMIQMMIAFLKPMEINEDAFGLEAMADVGPGGHFFGTAHTLARYENAFNAPVLADWSNFETWEENGSVDAAWRANRIYKELLAAHGQTHWPRARTPCR